MATQATDGAATRERPIITRGMVDSYEAAGYLPGDEQNQRTTDIHICPNMGEVIYRVIHDIRYVTPSRFRNGEDDDDALGWIWLGGERVMVATAYWGGMLLWRLAEEDDDPGATQGLTVSSSPPSERAAEGAGDVR